MKTVRCTMAQALVRYLCNQFTMVDGEAGAAVPRRLRHLRPRQRHLPVGSARGGAGHAADLARPERAVDGAGGDRLRQGQAPPPDHGRRPPRSGPARLNMVTAAASPTPTACRCCCSSGDTFVNRRPDPVHAAGRAFRRSRRSRVNDAFQAVTRYWDRITHPGADHLVAAAGGRHHARSGRLRPGLHRAAAGRAGAGGRLSGGLLRADRARHSASAARPRCVWPRRSSCCKRGQAAADHRGRRRALFRWPRRRWRAFAERRGIPVCRDHRGQELGHAPPPRPCRPDRHRRLDLGQRDGGRGRRRCSPSARACRTSRPARGPPSRRRALHRHQRGALRRDQAPGAGGRRRRARDAGRTRRPRSATGRPTPAWTDRTGRRAFAQVEHALDDLQKPTNEPVPTYAQVIGVVNAQAGERDYVITAAGGLPGEMMKNWRVKAPNTFDCEFGFSCMGYEIAGRLGRGDGGPDPHADRHGRRRHLYDDELGHLFDRAHRPQDDPHRLRQWRLRGDQPAAERQGRRRPSTT